MGRSRWNLTPWLILSCSIAPVWAAKKPFNINDDLLAYPQVRYCYRIPGYLRSCSFLLSVSVSLALLVN